MIRFDIVKNAIQSSPENGQIIVTTERSAKGVLMTIEDQGTGIPDAVRAHVFEPFYISKIGAEEAGKVLGLAIARMK